jgi:hypothetical protein
MAIDPYEGYQTHFGFDHFDLEPMAFSRPANNPYSDYYDLGWRNHPNFSWQNQATGNSAHSVTNFTIKHFIHHLTSILPASNGNHLHIMLTLRITSTSTNLLPYNSLHSNSLRPHHLLDRILTF